MKIRPQAGHTIRLSRSYQDSIRLGTQYDCQEATKTRPQAGHSIRLSGSYQDSSRGWAQHNAHKTLVRKLPRLTSNCKFKTCLPATYRQPELEQVQYLSDMIATRVENIHNQVDSSLVLDDRASYREPVQKHSILQHRTTVLCNGPL
jgi:hypothetical protein